MNEEELKSDENEENPHTGKAYLAFGVIAALIAITIFIESEIFVDPFTLVMIIGFGINFFLWFWLMKVLTDIRDSLRK
jgi:uncharacterized membrane protein